MLRLHLERVVPAPPPAVFRAHAEPAELARWWGPRGFSVPSAEMDVRPGGRYRLVMQPPEGAAFALAGEFREVEPPARLGYTFRWEDPHPDDRETVVTVSFAARGGSTAVVVDHGDFATEERLRLHEQGWSETLERLREAFPAA